MRTIKRVVFLATCLLAVANSRAATQTWTGVIDGSWLNATNWLSTNAPVSGDDLIFDANMTTLSTDIGASLSVNSLTVNDIPSNMTIAAASGTLTLGAGGIAKSTHAGWLNLDAPMSLSAPQTWTIGADSGGQIGCHGAIANNGNDLTLDLTPDDANRDVGTAITYMNVAGGRMTGSGRFIKTGAGFLTLEGGFESDATSTDFGGFDVQSGIVRNEAGNWGDAAPIGNQLTVRKDGIFQNKTAHMFGASGRPVTIEGGLLQMDSEAYVSAVTMKGGVIRGYSDLRGYADLYVQSSPDMAHQGVTWNMWGTRNVTVEDGANAVDLNFCGPFSGDNRLVKYGNGAMYMGQATHSGGLAIYGGTVVAGGADFAGSGAIRMSGGRLQFTDAGLWEGALAGDFNFMDAVPTGGRAQLTTAKPNKMGGGFGDHTTWVYSGLINITNEGGVAWTFSEKIDDTGYLKIDEDIVLSDSTWDAATWSTYSLSQGIHTIEFRAGNGTGGWGAVDFWPGFGIDRLGRDSGDYRNYTAPVDPGDGSLFFRSNVSFDVSNPIEITGDAVIDMGGTHGPVTARIGRSIDGNYGKRLGLDGGICVLGSASNNVAINCSITNNTALVVEQAVLCGRTWAGTGTATIVSGGALTAAGADSVPSGIVLTSGVLRVGHRAALGTGTVALAGSALELVTVGLDEGELSGDFNITDPNPSQSVKLDTTQANRTDSGFFADHTTWMYSGCLVVTNPAGVTWTFGENFDDSVLLKIDGATVLNDGTWDSATIGTVTLAAGLHTYELRVGQGGGGLGANSGWSVGVGVDYQGRNTADASYFTTLTDPGDGSLLTRASVRFEGSLRLDADTTVRALGPGTVDLAAAIDSLSALMVLTNPVATTLSGPITGGTALNLTGPADVTVTGTNSYSGPTAVLGGTLRMNGVHTTAGDYTVAAGAMLSGTGYADGATANSGTVKPGTTGSLGTLTVGSYTQAAVAVFNVGIVGTAAGQFGALTVLSGAGLDGSLDIDLHTNAIGYTPVAGDSFVVINAAGGRIGQFAATNAIGDALPDGLKWDVQYTPTSVVLAVATIASPLTGYDAYSNAYALVGGPMADPNGDGWRNLAAYALGFDPTGTTHAGLSGGIATGKLSITFDVLDSRSDITYWAETSDTLMTNDSGWNWIWTNKPLQAIAGPNAAVLGTSGETNTVCVSDTSAGTNRFLRLRITRP